MKDHTSSGSDSESFRMPLSASQTYHLAMDLAQKCNNIFTILHEQCEEESIREIIDRFIIQTRSELHSMNKMWLYELNCECFRFYQPGGLNPESDDLRERLEVAGAAMDSNAERIYEELVLYHELCQLGKFPLDLKNSADIYTFCMNLRQDLSTLLLSLAQRYQNASNQKVLDEIVDHIRLGNQVLRQLNWQ